MKKTNVDDEAKRIAITAAKVIREEIRNLNFQQTAIQINNGLD